MKKHLHDPLGITWSHNMMINSSSFAAGDTDTQGLGTTTNI